MDVQNSIQGKTFFNNFRVSGLVSLFHKIVDLVKILVRSYFGSSQISTNPFLSQENDNYILFQEKSDSNSAEQLTYLLQDLLELYNVDIKNQLEQ